MLPSPYHIQIFLVRISIFYKVIDGEKLSRYNVKKLFLVMNDILLLHTHKQEKKATNPP